MAGILVPTVKTTCTQPQLIQGFIEGWFQLFNEFPQKASIGVLIAQHNLETGTGLDCWNWNISNVKYATSAGNVEYMMLANTWEIINGQKVMFQPPSPVTWFRSFRTLTSGIMFQMNFLRSNRYQAAWAAVDSGSIPQFAHLLKVAGYYSASETDYANALNYYFNKFMADPTFDQVMATLNPPMVVPTVPNVIEVQPQPNNDPNPVVAPAPDPVLAPTPAAPTTNIWAVINAFIVDIFNFGLKKL
jgi:hypothetical protein